MLTELNWKKKLITNDYTIYQNGQQAGKLIETSFSKSAKAELNDHQYSFITTGFFKHKTEIRDERKHKIVGEITYNTWMNKATITINGKDSHWKYNNFWNTQWSIQNYQGIEINYCGSSTSGNIQTNTEDALLIISGLFITNQSWQTSIIVLFIIFIPIFLSN